MSNARTLAGLVNSSNVEVDTQSTTNPAIFLKNDATDRQIAWPSSDDFQLGQWDGTTFTEQMRVWSGGAFGLADGNNFSRIRPINTSAIADDGVYQVTTNTCGAAIVTAYDFGSGHGLACFVSYASTAILIGNSSNGANSDTDGKVCIFKSANSHTTYVKNRLGSTRTFSISIIGSYTN